MMQGQRRDPWRPTCSGGAKKARHPTGAFPARRPSAPACLGWHGIAWAIVGSKDICSLDRKFCLGISGLIAPSLRFRSCGSIWGRNARRPISRVLSAPFDAGRPFLRTRLTARLARPTRTTERECSCARAALPSLFGLAPGGVYRAAPVARGAVRSCRPVSPLPAGCRSALRGRFVFCGTFPRVAPPDVIRHRIPVEPGFSFTAFATAAAVRPAGIGSDGGRTGRT